MIVYTCQDHVLESLKMAFFVVILDSKYSKMTPKFEKQKSQWLHLSIKFANPDGGSTYLFTRIYPNQWQSIINFVWLIFTIRSLHLTVQLYGSLMQVNGGLCSLTRVAYKTITIQFTLDNLSQIWVLMDGTDMFVLVTTAKKHKTYLQNCYRISMSDKLFTYTVFNYYFSLLSIL